MTRSALKVAALAFLLSTSVGYTGVTLASVGCATNITPETPKAAAALTADAVVIRVNELQAAVIQACGPVRTCAPGTISTALADQIVRTCIDLRTTLKAVPNGWQASVKTAWLQAKPRFSGVTDPAILAAIAAVDAILGSL